MTKTEALQCLMVLKASYPRSEIGQETLLAYASMLSDVDAQDAKTAVERLICTSKWFPTVAEIRAEVADAATAGLPAVELAWGEVHRAIGEVGHYQVPAFSCPEIASAVRAIGWRHICLDKNVTSTRSRFTDAYRAIRTGKVEAVQLGAHAPGRERIAAGPQKPVFQIMKGGE